MCARISTGRPVGWHATERVGAWYVGRYVGWFVGGSVGWWVGWAIRSVGGLVGWLVGHDGLQCGIMSANMHVCTHACVHYIMCA